MIWVIAIRRGAELDKIRACGRANEIVHNAVKDAVQVGVSTSELDEIAARAMHDLGATSSIRDVYDFPGAICVSVNAEVGHGVPGPYVLREGDVVKVDISLELDGFHTDSARTYCVGAVPRAAEATGLIDSAWRALQAGIDQAVHGRRCSDISAAIAAEVRGAGYTILRHAFGHGIGEQLHESPSIANFGPPNMGPRLRAGMVLAIEPVVAIRSKRALRRGPWTDVTELGDLSAHVEDTIIVGEGAAEIVTRQATKEDVDAARCRLPGTDCWLRPFVSSDAAKLVEMAAAEMDPILIEAWGRRVREDELFGGADGTVTVVETEDGEIVGFYSVTEKADVLHVNTIVIDNRYQGRGIGQGVMHKLRQAVAKHPRLRNLELCVQTNNSRAIRFYERLGLEHVGSPYANTYLMRWVIRDRVAE